MSMLGRIAEDEFLALTEMHQKIQDALESSSMSEDNKTYLRGVSNAIVDFVAMNKVLDRFQRQEVFNQDKAYAVGYNEGVSTVTSIVNAMRKRRKMPAQGPNTLGNYGMYAK